MVIKPVISQAELDRQICLDLCKQAERLFHEFDELNADMYANQMGQYNAQDAGIPADKKLEPRPKWQKKWAMPQEVYHWLRMAKPDGVTNFSQNLDFMRWFRNRHDWMKPFELADKPWQDIAGGTSEGGGPLPKEERDRLAKENAVVMDKDGNRHKAGETKC